MRRFFHSQSMLFATLVALGLSALPPAARAARPKPDTVVEVKVDRENGLYKPGETATFRIQVLHKGTPVQEGQVAATLSLDGGKTLKQEELTLGPEPATISGMIDVPGFLRCTAIYRKGRAWYGWGGAGFDPLQIKATTPMPKDFKAFWEQGRKKLAEIPVEPKLKPLPKYSNADADAYMISFATGKDSRLYGFFCAPKGKKSRPPFAAIVQIESAGLGKPRRPSTGWARRGILSLQMGVHDHELLLPAKEYLAMRKGRLKGYTKQGVPDREKYYYRKTILGLDRAVTWLANRPDFDGKHLVCWGSSQGGGMSLIMGGLNPRITAVCASVPALCDHWGDTVQRSAGWPRIYRAAAPKDRDAARQMAAYFDAVNFCRLIKAPTLVGVGFKDTTCCPSSVYSAYNVIQAPKRIFNDPDRGHGTPKSLARFMYRWIAGKLGRGKDLKP